MLKSLQINNYALINQIYIDFDEKLNIITGETGAGKSILVGALALVLGSRADSKHILNKSKKTIVEAVFLDYDSKIDSILIEKEFDVDDELVLRREINTSGKSRAFINDTPATLQTIQLLTGYLLDLNRQHEIRDIVDKDFHYKMVDSIAGIEKPVALYQSKYKTFLSKQSALKKLKEKIRAEIKEQEFNLFQYNELKALQVIEGEIEELDASIKGAKMTEEINHTFDYSNEILSNGEQTLDRIMIDLGQAWKKIAKVNPNFNSIYDHIQNIQEDIRELANTIDLAKDQNSGNIENLQEKENRLNLINNLLYKHQLHDETGLIDLMETLSNNLNTSEADQKMAIKLESEIEKLLRELESEAIKISKSRTSIFANLEMQVNEQLSNLSMEHASIKVFNEKRDKVNVYGIDNLEVLFSPNKGSEFNSIKKVASGGESARLMLCVKSTIANATELPTMIFDEIDTGVSGDVAGKMGKTLSKMGEKHQVIVITHLPQVAAKGKKHFFVYKEISEGKTISKMEVLNKEGRVTEIAKMLSGKPPSTSAIANAKDLLKLKSSSNK